MSVELDEKLVDQIVGQIKTQDDLADLSRQLLKAAIERVMAAELEDHLGYSKHSQEGHNTGNSRNGHTRKTIKGDFGEVDIQAPRDRNGEFSPKLIAKGKTRVNKLDQQILALYARGMTTRDITDALQKCMALTSLIASLVKSWMPFSKTFKPGRTDHWKACILSCILTALWSKFIRISESSKRQST